jgi:hypothetical protein
MSVLSWLVFAALMVPVVALCIAAGIWLNRLVNWLVFDRIERHLRRRYGIDTAPEGADERDGHG